ncbi:hypothetical protein KIPB_010755, partial [Kipferlia bialata]
YHRGSVFGNVQGQLVRVDINTLTAYPLALSLSPGSQPSVATDGDSLILPTPSGDRAYPLVPAERVGIYPVEVGVEILSAGVSAGGACVDGAVCVGDTCLRVASGVALPMVTPGGRGETATVESGVLQLQRVTSLETLTTLLDSGVGGRLDVMGTPDSPLHLTDSLARRTLTECHFTHCVVACLTGVQLHHCHFKNCVIREVGDSPADMSNASLTDCRIEGCDLSGVSLFGAVLNRLSIDTETSLTGIDLGRSHLSAIDLSGLDLTGCNLSETVFNSVDGLTATVLQSAVSVSGADLSGCDMTGWCLNNLDLSGCCMRDCTLSGASFVGSTLNGCDFRRATGLCAIHLTSAVSVSGVNLSGQEMAGWNLHGLNLSSANLSGADLFDTNLSGSIFIDADISNTTFDSANLSGAVLTGLDLSHRDLQTCQLNNAVLTGCKMEDTILDASTTEERMLKDCTTEGLVLRGSQLKRVVGLSEAMLQTAADLTGMRLEGCNLTGLDLSGVDMSGTHFVDCQLHNAIFYGTNMFNCQFTSCELSGSFQGVDLSGSLMRDCSILFTDISEADLTHVDWDESNNVHGSYVAVEYVHGATMPYDLQPLWKGTKSQSITRRVSKLKDATADDCVIPPVLGLRTRDVIECRHSSSQFTIRTSIQYPFTLHVCARPLRLPAVPQVAQNADGDIVFELDEHDAARLAARQERERERENERESVRSAKYTFDLVVDSVPVEHFDTDQESFCDHTVYLTDKETERETETEAEDESDISLSVSDSEDSDDGTEMCADTVLHNEGSQTETEGEAVDLMAGTEAEPDAEHTDIESETDFSMRMSDADASVICSEAYMAEIERSIATLLEESDTNTVIHIEDSEAASEAEAVSVSHLDAGMVKIGDGSGICLLIRN